MPDAAHEVISPDAVRSPGTHGDPPPPDAGVADGHEEAEIESPAKIIRIGGMVKQLLDEVRNTSLDEASREQLREIYENSLAELKTALSPELAAELERLALDFEDDSVPSESQLRIAKAQLVGWLEGLFHGIQATLMAQQMAAHNQLETMRRQLPSPGSSGEGSPPGGPGYI
ncbi:MAG: proteasome activator [Microthrixaceae bacterium]